MKPWLVKNTAFSEKVSPHDMSVFRRICPDRKYEKGEAVFHAGDRATAVHVVASGQIKLVMPTASGNERILAICGPNDFIGEAFLSENARYRVDAVALTDAMTCPVSRDQFLQMSLHAPNLALTFCEILASHLFHCRDQLSSSYAPVKVRVIKVLLEQAERFGEPKQHGWVELSTELKHEEIASMISATRVSVSMAVADLRNDGVLEGTRGEYLLNVPALRDLQHHNE